MLYIILSKKEDCIARTKKIIELSPDNIDVIFIEDYLNFPENYSVNDQDVVYILNNSKCIIEFINKIEVSGCRILNKSYYLSGFSKSDIQKKLSETGIQVPALYDYEKLQKSDFPIFIKSLNHVDIVLKAYSFQSIEYLFTKFDKKDFYLESAVDKEGSKEYKIYFVNDNCFFYDGIADTYPEIKDICLKIKKVLELDIFSMDFIVNERGYYIIDINSSAGLYMSEGSRKALIKESHIE